MAEKSGKTRQRGGSRLRRWFVRSLLGGVVLLCTLYLGRSVFLEPLIKSQLEDVFDQHLGMTVTIEDLGGTYGTGLELTRFRTTVPASQGTLRSLDVEKLELRYDVTHLFSGLDSFLANARISARGVTARIQLEADDSPDQTSSGLELPLTLPEFLLENVSVQILGEGYGIDILGLAIEGKGGVEGTKTVARLTSREVSVTHPVFGMDPAPLDLDLEYEAGTVTAKNVRLQDELISPRLFVDLSAMALGEVGFESELRFRESSLSLTGAILEDELTGRFELNSPALESLPEVLGMKDLDLQGRVASSGNLVLNLTDPLASTGSISLSLANASLLGRRVTRVEATAHLLAEVLEIPGCDIVVPGASIQVESLRLPRKSLADPTGQLAAESCNGDFVATVSDLPLMLEELDTWIPGIHPSAEATLDVAGVISDGQVVLQSGDISLPTGRIHIDQARAVLPLRDRGWGDCTCEAKIRWEFEDLSSLSDLMEMPFPVRGRVGGRVAVEGTLGSPVFVSSFTGSELALSETPIGGIEASIRGGLEEILIESLEFRNGDDELSFEGLLDLAGGPELRDARLRVEAADVSVYLGDVLKHPLGTQLLLEDLFFRYSPDPDKVRARVRGEVSRLVWDDGVTGNAELDVEVHEGEIVISYLGLSMSDTGEAAIFGRLPCSFTSSEFLERDLQINAFLECPDLRKLASRFLSDTVAPSGAIAATASFEGTVDSMWGFVDLRGQEIFGVLPDVSVPLSKVDFSAQIHVEPERISLDRFSVRSDEASFNGRGEWKDPDISALLAEENGIGLASLCGTLDFLGNLNLSRLDWLSGSMGLRRVQGRVLAELGVTGPASAPNWLGTVELSDGAVRLDGSMPPIESVEVRAELQADELRLSSATGEVGASPFRMHGSIRQWMGVDPKVDVRLTGEDLLLFRDDGVKVRANADLAVQGSPESLLVSGDLSLTDCRVVKNVEYLNLFQAQFSSLLEGGGAPSVSNRLGFFSFREPPLRDMRFDITVTSAQPVRLKNNVARGGVRPELKVTGTGEIPVVYGAVYFDPTRIALPGTSFQVDSGVVLFDRTDPDRPVLDLVARERILGYDVTMIFQGPFDEMNITLSSSPPLSNDDLLYMVLTGVLPRTAEGNPDASMDRAVVGVATFLGKDFLGRFFSDESTEAGESIIDRFDVDVGRDVSQKGEETIEAKFRIQEGVFRPTSTLYLTGERDRYDDYNVGMRLVFRFR